MSLIGLLALVLFICIVLWAAKALMAAFGVGDPIRTVIWVVLVLLCLVYVLPLIGVPFPPASVGRLR